MTANEQDVSEKSESTEEPKLTEKPEVTDEHRAAAKEMRKAYDEELPTVTMPGTNGAVSGTAVNDWIDDDGNPKYSDITEDGDQGKDAESRGAESRGAESKVVESQVGEGNVAEGKAADKTEYGDTP